ncbi:MAG: conjugal transfer protein TraF [Syntrophales bacterium]
MRRIIIILALLFILRPPFTVQGAESSQWTDHERGWFWYELIPEEIPEEPLVEPPPAPTPTPVTVPAPQKPQGPPPLSAEWIRENLEKYQRLAIDNPTAENVAAYLYIQRVMLDKSQRFSEQVKHVVQLDPFLDQGTRRPIASYGGAQFSKEALAARQRLMVRIAQQAGIFFFFQGGCGHCEIQAPVLNSIIERYSFVVFPISIDGQPLKNGLFPKYVMDRGQARQLQVIQTPAMFLGKPNSRDIIPLGQSALSRDQLEDRILTAARDAGWITPQEYESTRGFKTEMALDLKPDSLPADLKEQDLIPYIQKLYSQRLTGGVKGANPSETGENCGECGFQSTR